MIDFLTAVENELKAQHLRAQEADDEVQSVEKDHSDFDRLATEIVLKLGNLGFTIDTSTLQQGPPYFSIPTLSAGSFLIGIEQGQLFFITDDGRRVDVVSDSDLLTAAASIAKDYLWKYAIDVEDKKISALREIRPVLPPHINGFYGPLLVRFTDYINPGMTLRAYTGSGDEVFVRVRDYIFMHKLYMTPELPAETPWDDSYIVKYRPGLIRMANTTTKKGVTVRIKPADIESLGEAISRYIQWHNRLCTWSDIVKQAGISLRDVEDVEW